MSALKKVAVYCTDGASWRDKILIHEILPAEFPETGGKITHEFFGDDKILVRYFNYANGKLNPRIPHAVSLSRYLIVDEALGAFVGLILTEGLQSRKGECRSRFILMNCDWDVVKFCYNFLTTKLRIPQDLCIFKLYHPSTWDTTTIRKTKADLKGELALPKSLKMPSYSQEDLKQPKIALFINRRVFRLIVDGTIKESLHYIETDERFRTGFLQGFSLLRAVLSYGKSLSC